MKNIGIAMMFLFFIGCDSSNESTTAGRSASDTQTSIRPVGHPREYFPHEVGTRWEYTITTGEREPLNFRETRWPMGNVAVLQATRGRFYRVMTDGSPTQFNLIIRVERETSKQGFLEYPEGVKLAIERDDMGVFEDTSAVYYAIRTSGNFEVLQVLEYPPGIAGAPSGPWGTWGDPGHALRIVFMAEAPWIQKGIGKEPEDTFLSLGVDASVPGYAGQPLLHFVRTVEAAKKESKEESNVLDSKFTEDVWFARGKGLVRLEQKVDGVRSMVWSLKNFNKQ